MTGGIDIEDIIAAQGDPVLPAWQGLTELVDDFNIVFGRDVKVTRIAGGGFAVSAKPQATQWIHPWRMSTPDNEDKVLLVEGTVNTHIPWITEELKLGQEDDLGQPARVQLHPLSEGASYLAVGVNIGQGDSEEDAALPPDPTFEHLRLQEITELPRGLATGGVLPDDDGWAWYALAKIQWEERVVRDVFQIVYHNLSHEIVAGGAEDNQERHYFPPV